MGAIATLAGAYFTFEMIIWGKNDYGFARLAALAIGSFVFLDTAKQRQLTLNSQTEKVTIRTRTLTDHRQVELPLEALIEARCDVTNSGRGLILYKLYLEFSAQSAGTLAFNKYGTPWGNYEKAAKIINTWLANHAPVDSTRPQA